jgi:hypothetical protein
MLANQPHRPDLVFSSYLLAIAPSLPQRKVCTKPGTVQVEVPLGLNTLDIEVVDYAGTHLPTPAE